MHSDEEFAQDVADRLRREFADRRLDNWRGFRGAGRRLPEILVRNVQVSVDGTSHWTLHVDYEASGRSQSVTYVFDDWTDGSMERSADAVAQGFATLARVEIRERVETEEAPGAPDRSE